MIRLTDNRHPKHRRDRVFTFRVFFRHGMMELVRAESAAQARHRAAEIAKERGTTVSKVKVVRDV